MMSVIKQLLIWFGIALIRIYQAVLSPLFPPACRYTPTCSQYGIEAIKKYGFLKGFALTIKRISRCRPGGGSGHDPVP
ncbi:MAG: membrane protein insertion efficiency factor YidD [Bacteroidota bacterium]